MIIFSKSDSSLTIPVGLGVSIGPLDASLVPLEVDSSTVAQSIMPSGDGFSSVTVNPYMLESVTINSSTAQQVITPQNADGLSSVTVNGYYLAHVEESITENGQYVITPLSAGADGLADVTLYVSVESSYNWILEARKGTLSDLSGYSLPAPVRSNQYCGLLQSTNMTNMPALETGNGVLDVDYAFSYAFENTPLRNVEIGFTEINGNGAFRLAFASCTNLTSVSFPELIYIRGYESFQYAFDYCRSLTSVSFPKLRDVTTSIGSVNWFPTDSGVVNFTVHPDALQTDRPAYNIIYSAKNVTNLTLTAPVTNSLYVPWQSRLSAESVKGILEKLDLTVSDKQVDFYDGLTVTDDTQGSLQTAYDNATAAGWTINNLTIVPYS